MLILRLYTCTLFVTVQKVDRCCACDSVTPREIGNVPTNHLLTEYILPRGARSLLVPQPGYNSSLPSVVVHSNERLKSFPENLCKFPEVVNLDLSHNQIDEIPDISCVQSLELIDLSNNEIRYISNLTFNNLLLLRKLNLAQNVITTIDTNSFQGKARTISTINLSANKLTQADVSNGIFNNTFCEINLDSNLITEITNHAGFKVDNKSKYGNGGHITFHNSSLTQFLISQTLASSCLTFTSIFILQLK